MKSIVKSYLEKTYGSLDFTVGSVLEAAKLSVYERIGNNTLLPKLEKRVIHRSTDSQSRHCLKRKAVNWELEKEKLKQCQHFVQSKIKEQREREERKQKQTHLYYQRIQEEDTAKAKEQEEVIKKHTEEQKNLRLKNLVEKSQMRKQNIRNLREFANKAPKTTPLYKKIESNYEENIVLPNLIRRTEILKQKKSSVNRVEIAQHSKKYDTNKTSHQFFKNDLFVPKEEFHKLLSDEKKYKEEFLQREIQHKNKLDSLRNKKKQFEDMVKSEFKPKIDPHKKREMAVIRAKLEIPVPKKLYFKHPSEGNFDRFKNKSRQHCRSVESVRPMPKSVNYLEKRRVIRSKLEGTVIGNPIKNPQRIEHILKGIVNKDPYNLSVIESEDAVNEVILDSLKAKLKLISN